MPSVMNTLPDAILVILMPGGFGSGKAEGTRGYGGSKALALSQKNMAAVPVHAPLLFAINLSSVWIRSHL